MDASAGRPGTVHSRPFHASVVRIDGDNGMAVLVNHSHHSHYGTSGDTIILLLPRCPMDVPLFDAAWHSKAQGCPALDAYPTCRRKPIIACLLYTSTSPRD